MREPTEMELRVAKALFRAEYENIPHYQWEQEASSPEVRAYWVKCARTAIRAMREPTPEMLGEYMNCVGPLERGQLHPTDFWKILIDAASPKDM